MKGGLKLELTKRDPGAITNAMGSRDYFVTTMHVRKLALSDKRQSRRHFRYTKSAPPFQNRNLENFPMPHGREDAIRSAQGQRSHRCANTAQVTRARVDSGSMKDYCKQMFDFTIHNASRNHHTIPSKVREKTKPEIRSRAEAGGSARSNISARLTNGPTPDGSILHNQKQKVLNDIRIRSFKDYEKQRSSSRNSLQEKSLQNTIREKNRNYRVCSVTCDSRRHSSNVCSTPTNGSDMVFIPVTAFSDAPVFTRQLLESSRIGYAPSLSEYIESDSIATNDPFDDTDVRSISVSEDFRPVNHSSRPNSCFSSRTMLPATTACNIRLVSLDEESPPESEEEPEAEVVEEKKPEPQTSAKTTKQKGAELEDEKGKSVPPEPEPEPEPVKVKLILKGPHCWVDDATVSSDQSDHEDLDVQPEDDALHVAEDTESKDITTPVSKIESPSKTDTKQNSKRKSTLKNVVDEKKEEMNAPVVQTDKVTSKEGLEKVLQPTDTDNKDKVETENPVSVVQPDIDLNGNDTNIEENDEVKLPSFICPSSERKSREAALKQWLASTCFRSGPREMPIL